MENATIIKEFSYSQVRNDLKFFSTIIKRETPETETGLTYEVLKQTGVERPVIETYDRFAIAEMDFKNFVLQALNNDLFYTYSAER